MHRILLVGLTALLLSGCTAPAVQPETPEPTSVADAVGLINMWRVSDAAGTGTESWLRLDGSEWMAWVDCGVVGGDWKTSGDLLVASVYMSMGPDSHCLFDGGAFDPSVDWLLAATSFRQAGAGYELLDSAGAVVASLGVDGNPPTQSEYFLDSYTEAPDLTDAIRAQFTPPATLPEWLKPAADILGRWEPDELGDGEHPYVEFNSDGSWRGSDGCNGMGGRWLQGGGGLFLGTGGISTQIGCLNSPAPGWVAAAARVGTAGGELSFVDASGAVIGTLRRP